MFWELRSRSFLVNMTSELEREIQTAMVKERTHPRDSENVGQTVCTLGLGACLSAHSTLEQARLGRLCMRRSRSQIALS